MTYVVQNAQAVDELGRELVAAGFSPFIGTRCEALSRLHEALDLAVGVLGVPGDDNAVGIAAGVALAGGCPAVLLRGSGPGGCAEVIATVVAPHQVPVLLVVALDDPDDMAPGSAGMIRVSERVLDEFGVQTVPLDPTMPAADQVAVVRGIVRDQARPAALLVPATVYGRVT